MTNCPDCGGKLGPSASRCRCGWGKPMLPAAQQNAGPKQIQCADDQACRKPGLMWVEGLDKKARICVEHYYTRLEKA